MATPPRRRARMEGPAAPLATSIETPLVRDSGAPVAAGDLGQAMCAACTGGDVDKVRGLLACGCNVQSICMRTGRFPIALAAANGHSHVVELLSQSGVSVDLTRTHKSDTAMILAAQNGHADTLRSLLAGGANINLGNSSGRTPLHVASKGGHLAAVLTLLELGASIDVCDASGSSPLALAIKECRYPCVEALLRAGAALHQVQHASRSHTTQIITTTAMHGDVKMVRLLCEAGCDVQGLPAHSSSWVPPLQAAVGHRQYGVAEELLEFGASANVSAWGSTPLHLATVLAEEAGTSVNEIATLLLQKESITALGDIVA